MGPEEELAPWERQPHEPALWFGRFAVYRDLGPARSVMEAWRIDKHRRGNTSKAKSPNNSWYTRAMEWEWDKRATAYDAYMDHQKLLARQEEIRLKREAEAEAREESRQQRRQILTGFLGKLAQSLNAFEADDATLNELTRATQMVVEQLRAEYNDLPTQRIGFDTEDELDAAIEEQFERLLSAAGGLAPVAGGEESAVAPQAQGDVSANPGGSGESSQSGA